MVAEGGELDAGFFYGVEEFCPLLNFYLRVIDGEGTITPTSIGFYSLEAKANLGMRRFQAIQRLLDIPQGPAVNMAQPKGGNHPRALARCALHFESPPGFFRGLRQQWQAETDSLALLRREEGVHRSSFGLFVHSFTVVDHFEHEPIRLLALGQPNDDMLGLGPQGVLNDVEDM